MTDEVRPAVVEALFAATQDPELSDEVTRDMLLDATPAERQAVADLHGHVADHLDALVDLSAIRLAAVMRAYQLLYPAWIDGRSIFDALKVVRRELADQVLRILYDGGWSGADGLPPRPGEQT